jgi:hypothetical protein
MNTKEFRAAVNAEILSWGAASFPTLPLVFENGPLHDRDKIGPIFLDCEVRWYGGKPLSIGGGASGRYSGALSMQLYHRATLGTADPDDILDSLTDYMKVRRIGASIISFPQRTIPTHLLGWYKVGLLFPFTLDH